MFVTAARVGSGARRRARSRDRWRHVPALLIAAGFLLPLVFMVTGSLRQAGLPPPRTPELVPSPLAFGNYARAFELVDLPRYALNSLIVVAFAVPLSVLFASWAGFALSRLGARARAALVALSLVALMVPITALLVPRFALFKSLGLTDTYVPLIAPALIGTSPFYVLLYYWSFRRLPSELFDAARLEGVGLFSTWRRVAMPLVRPVTVAVAVLAFVFTWSNFLDPLIYIFDEERFTLPLGLRALAALDRQNFPLLLAGSVVATAPVVGAFLYVQRFFLQEFRGTGWFGR
ncbi:MAG: carbohydrate ABC transporter permease [Actinomycetota bacterium]|nr:carbohydrate ABC transporter permease [Actinomycetota bacterium]